MKERFAKISKYLGSMFESVTSVVETNNPMKFSFGSLALQELFREYFAITSKDADVKAACWYHPEHNESGNKVVTRRQRIIFAIYSFVD